MHLYVFFGVHFESKLVYLAGEQTAAIIISFL